MVTGPSNPNHHMMTGQTAQTNQFPEFFTGRILKPRNPPSYQYQNLSTQVSQDKNLPVVEQTPRNQNSDVNNSINRLADATAGIATQQRPQAATMLKPVSTNTLIFDGKNEKFELFEDLFHTMLKMQPEMTEAMKINHFHAHLRKEALRTFRNNDTLDVSNVNVETRHNIPDQVSAFSVPETRFDRQPHTHHNGYKYFLTGTQFLWDHSEIFDRSTLLNK